MFHIGVDDVGIVTKKASESRLFRDENIHLLREAFARGCKEKGWMEVRVARVTYTDTRGDGEVGIVEIVKIVPVQSLGGTGLIWYVLSRDIENVCPC